MNGDTGIGAAILRKEDMRFLTGEGNYVADIKLPDMTAACSCAPRTRTRGSCRSIPRRRRAMPGVVAVFTGADLAADKSAACRAPGRSASDGTPTKEPAHPALAQGKVRCVGDAVAFVDRRTLEQAREAAEAMGWTTRCCPLWSACSTR